MKGKGTESRRSASIFVDVVDEFARYAVLVRGEALPETTHGPVHAIPVESGEAAPIPKVDFPRSAPELGKIVQFESAS